MALLRVQVTFHVREHHSSVFTFRGLRGRGSCLAVKWEVEVRHFRQPNGRLWETCWIIPLYDSPLLTSHSLHCCIFYCIKFSASAVFSSVLPAWPKYHGYGLPVPTNADDKRCQLRSFEVNRPSTQNHFKAFGFYLCIQGWIAIRNERYQGSSKEGYFYALQLDSDIQVCWIFKNLSF